MTDTVGFIQKLPPMVVAAFRATLEELGRELGVSKERVRQLEHRAMTKLRESILRRVETSTDLFIEA